MQVIGRHGIAELNRGARALLTEEDHVGEVGVIGVIVGWVLAENAARGEDCLDSADDEAGWVEVHIASIVLVDESVYVWGVV